jgi:hypothetical protein
VLRRTRRVRSRIGKQESPKSRDSYFTNTEPLAANIFLKRFLKFVLIRIHYILRTQHETVVRQFNSIAPHSHSLLLRCQEIVLLRRHVTHPDRVGGRSEGSGHRVDASRERDATSLHFCNRLQQIQKQTMETSTQNPCLSVNLSCFHSSRATPVSASVITTLQKDLSSNP